MANLVIKPASGSGNKLVFQNQAGAVDAITVEDSGNTTLAGTANNLGTVTTGTFEGTLNSATTFSGDAGQRTAKAWAYFDGTGTPSFHDSYNCSTITDHALGIYSVNYTNNLDSADYAAVASAGKCDDAPNGVETRLVVTNKDGDSTVALCKMAVSSGGWGTPYDDDNISLIVFGD
jgi:hypothetical protein